MNLASVIVLIIIAVLSVLAIRRIRRKKLLFSCGGDCSHCQMNCKDRKP